MYEAIASNHSVLISWIVISWVISSWIGELTIVVLGHKVGLNLGSNSHEVGHVGVVGDVGVKVILEMLKHVHVVLNVSVSSNSWEGEGGIVKLPGVDVEVWWGSSLLLHGGVDVEGVGPVSSIEGSGEHINLVVKLLNGLIKIDALWLVKLNVHGVHIGGRFRLDHGGGLSVELVQVLHISSLGNSEEK